MWFIKQNGPMILLSQLGEAVNVWRDILADLVVHKVRTLLTAISLFLGVVAVMAIITTGDVVGEVFVSQAEQPAGGGRLQTFQRDTTPTARTGNQEIVAAILQLPQPDQADVGCKVNPSNAVSVTTVPNTNKSARLDNGSSLSLFFVCGNYEAIYRLPMSQGHWLSDDSITSPYEAVFNKAAASQCGGPGTIVWMTGDTTPTALPVQVIGVVNDGIGSPNLYSNAVPWLVNAPQLFTAGTFSLLWRQYPATQREVTAVTSDWLFDHGFPNDGAAFETDQVSQYQEFIGLVKWSFTGVAALSLAVAALGIVNVGLASVRERTRELVVRRALGASKMSVVRMIVGSSLLLSLLVAAVAALAVWAGLAVFAACQASDSPIQAPSYPVFAAVIGVGVSLVTALLGSLVPGLVASRLQPGLALRD